MITKHKAAIVIVAALAVPMSASAAECYSHITVMVRHPPDERRWQPGPPRDGSAIRQAQTPKEIAEYEEWYRQQPEAQQQSRGEHPVHLRVLEECPTPWRKPAASQIINVPGIPDPAPPIIRVSPVIPLGASNPPDAIRVVVRVAEPGQAAVLLGVVVLAWARLRRLR